MAIEQSFLFGRPSWSGTRAATIAVGGARSCCAGHADASRGSERAGDEPRLVRAARAAGASASCDGEACVWCPSRSSCAGPPTPPSVRADRRPLPFGGRRSAGAGGRARRRHEVSVEQVGCLTVVARHEVSAAVEGGRDGSVAHVVAERLGVAAGGDHERGVRVAALVQPDALEADFAQASSRLVSAEGAKGRPGAT